VPAGGGFVGIGVGLGVGGGGAGVGAALMVLVICKNLSGDPLFRSLIFPVRAAAFIASSAWSDPIPPSLPRNSATTPATCGQAIDVPLMVSVCVSEV